MKRFLRVVRTPILCMLCIAVAAAACLAFVGGGREAEAEKAAWPGILRLWQIDSFEGGKGSRASFLNGVARVYEQGGGMFVLITVHTPESAAIALQKGQRPDMISYGAGVDFVADIARPLPGYTCSAGELGGKTYAYPWCRGGYFLLTGEGDFSVVSPENTVLSSGPNASVMAAAALEGLNGNYMVKDSVQAYVDLIGGKYKYMLGSQRDVWRLRTRGFSFTAKPLTAFNDLLQYISVCTEDAQRYAASLDFLEVLFSRGTQESVTKIGMMSIDYAIYADDPVFLVAESEIPRSTVPAFLSQDARGELDRCAESALKGDKSGAKKLKNYLADHCKKSSIAV